MHPNLQVVLKRDRIERPFIKKDGSEGKKPRVFFQCYKCDQLFKRTEIKIDHIEPVGPTPRSKYAPPGYTWDAFIDRLFCAPENLACICETCHAEKTKAERAVLSAEYHKAG